MAVGVRRKTGLHRNNNNEKNDINDSGGDVDDDVDVGQCNGGGRGRRIESLSALRWEATGQLFAVKEMSWRKIEDGRRRMTEDPINEVRAMQYFMDWYRTEDERRRSRRPGQKRGRTENEEEESAYDIAVRIMGETNVIVPVDVLTDHHRLYIVTPLCDGGDLFGLVEHNNGRDAVFTEAVARALLIDILNGIGHLQRAGLAHRDISLENVLISQGSCIIVDLGQCVRIPRQGARRYLMSISDNFGKQAYRPPESWIEGGGYDGYAADLWMVAIVLVNILLGRHPWDQAVFYGDKYFKLGCCREQLSEAFKMRGNIGRGLSEECLDLLQGCLRWDPRRRLGIQEMQAHPWMLGIAQQVPGLLRCDYGVYNKKSNTEERSHSCRDEAGLGPADCKNTSMEIMNTWSSYLQKQAV